MKVRFSVVAASLLIVANGCGTVPLPGGAGEVSGPLRGIELYTKRPEREEHYPTYARERFFASDREIWVVSWLALPGPGDYVSKVVLRSPGGTVHREREYRFRAEASSWLTGQRIELPRGEAAKPLGGRWEVEVSLDAKPVGRRTFTFDPSSIRLRTDARLVIAQGKGDIVRSPGEWRSLEPYAQLERTKAALGTLGVVLRDELARRFPHVEGPRTTLEASDATVLLTPSLIVLPDLDADSRLELEVVHLPTKDARKFHFKTSAGREKLGYEGFLNFTVEGADLAVKAASSPDVLEFLVSATQAVPE
jgi:hypothetical protein